MTEESSFMITTEMQKREIYKNVNYISDDQIRNDVDEILEWVNKQPHLIGIEIDPRFIKNLLICRKGSVEQSKQKIELMYSLKNIPNNHGSRDILEHGIQNSLKSCTFLTLPKLNHDLARVNILSYKGEIEHFKATDLVRFICMVVEYRMLLDCFAGEHFIIDLQDFTWSHMLQFTPHLIKHAELHVMKAFGLRVFGIHIVNGTIFLNTVLSILKIGLSEKLRNRIYIHRKNEDLYKLIDKTVLPIEYGGNERSFFEMKETWISELTKEDIRNYLKAQENAKFYRC